MIPTLSGITSQTVVSSRLSTRVLSSGKQDGIPVLFLHGNASSATFWEEVMLALPAAYRGIAPDLRGYGEADRSQLIDATRGLGDLADDAVALLDALGVGQAHVVGHSLGGSVVWRLLMDYAPRFLSATVVCPGSPFGFGGTKGLDGAPCFADFAGSGGGTVNPEFVKLMAAGDRSADNPQASPRVVMNGFYWKPPFRPAREEELLSSMLSEHVGEQQYPGDSTASENWPGVAPGVWGPINAMSPKYAKSVKHLYAIEPKPPILWVRGSHDLIVSDSSFFDFATLGSMNIIPGWPGAAVMPPQPMVSQTRAVLAQYAAAGGAFLEVVMEETGHSPYIERPAEFNQHFHAFMQS
ncbi:MAG: alpha/beta hydrolase [Caldilineaceae bacterium]|nr:alpha/beta hydrolase [Caldilineaceae bacterium]MCB9156993.1 alpha/beta hydrolase [Caldilineaceae bacterium]